jgi:hypothetical protein
LPEGEQTSKHGGGRRYNAILEFKGEKIKKIDEKERKKKKKSEYKEKNNEKRKNVSMRENKISSRFSKVH